MKETLRGCPQRSPGPAPPSLRVGPVSAWHCRPSAPGTSSSVSRRAGPLARRSSCVCKNIYLPLCSKGVFAGRSILDRRVFASLGPARPLRWPRRVPQHPLPPSLWLPGATLLFLWLLLRLLSLSLVLSSLIKVRFGVSFCVLSFVCLSLYFLTGASSNFLGRRVCRFRHTWNQLGHYSEYVFLSLVLSLLRFLQLNMSGHLTFPRSSRPLWLLGSPLPLGPRGSLSSPATSNPRVS